MSLKSVLQETTQNKRKSLLSQYLKNNNGLLEKLELEYFKQLFAMYYTPDENEIKYKPEEILSVSIEMNTKHFNKCFILHTKSCAVPASIKRLSGSTRTTNANVKRAMRNGIKLQVLDFKKKNPLDSEKICPITKKSLGLDAEVDHKIPFHILADKWLKQNKNPAYSYNFSCLDYVLTEPYLEKWRDFHLKHAELRWLSKEGNQIAHTLYENKK